jgi:hypothetical protein
MRVRVVGTHFIVSRPPDGAHVEVTKGIVEVTTHGETHAVRAGESWPPALPTQGGNSAVPPGAPPVVAAPPGEPVATSAPLSANTPPPAAPSRSLARPHGRARSDSALRHDRGIVKIAPPPEEPTPPPPPPSIAQPPGLVLPPPAATATEPSPAAPQPPPPPSSTPPRPTTPQELYESAARLEARDPDGALALYARLASGSGAWAANALYAEGRLRADRGQRAEARKLLSEYLTRFPEGPNAADARDLVQRLR